MLIFNLTVIEIVINTIFTYLWKNDLKAHGWQFTAAVNDSFSRYLSLTEAHAHQSVSWDLSLLSIPTMSMVKHNYIVFLGC